MFTIEVTYFTVNVTANDALYSAFNFNFLPTLFYILVVILRQFITVCTEICCQLGMKSAPYQIYESMQCILVIENVAVDLTL